MSTVVSAGDYDVFVSLAGPDRAEVRELVDELRNEGLRVFLDERDIPYFLGITAEIEAALRGSKALLAYYSKAFPLRAACQFELTAAFLAGQREGDPARRLMVVNPEPTTHHLQPVELADARFVLMPAPRDRAAMGRTAARVAARVRQLSGRIGGVPFTERPHRHAGAHGFVGRHRELWALHSALSESSFPLTQAAMAGPAAILTGLPGIGKTALVSAYAWRFGAAHLGGVYWLSLAASRPHEVPARFAAALAAAGGPAGEAVAGVAPERVPGVFADLLASQAEPSLVVVDDLPPDLDPRTLAALVLGGGVKARTVLVTSSAPYDAPVRRVELGPMSLHDSTMLLHGYRQPDTPDEAEALERIAGRLDGHAYALRLAGNQVRGRQDLLSYVRYADGLHADLGSLRPVVVALFRDALSTLDVTQRLVLQLFLVCGPGEVPAGYIAQVLDNLHPDGRHDVGSALVSLGDRSLATQVGPAWKVHALVRDSALAYLEPVVPEVDVARAAAAAVLASPAQERLMGHAGALSERPDLPDPTVESLLRLVADHHGAHGEAVLAAPFRRRLADRHPTDPAAWVRSAQTHHAAGHPEAAIADAARAMALTDDPTVSFACRRVTAESLDALGRFTDADPIWQELVWRTEMPSIALPERLATLVAWLRSMRIRGRGMRVRQEAEKLLRQHGERPDEALFHHVQGARLELARAQLMTDDQGSARDNAGLVVSRYVQRGLALHNQALDAQQVFAEAQLALPLFELRPDRARWYRAEQSLDELQERLRRSHGRRNLATLTATVAHAQALVALGKPQVARETLTVALPDIAERCGGGHPLHHQAAFLLGQAHSQLAMRDEAKRWYRCAFEGLRDLFGADHPHTLAAQLELGIAMKLTGEGAEASRIFAAVLKAVPRTVGRKTDLYGRALFARLLTVLPAPVWSWLSGPPKHRRTT
ncbi:MAG TPA: toll/interleukin-1 receptor domain-containing protein [Micromonosporaceae bacterium]|nr:toll/interleukin-1 receptor domain-containing protein [Micromonosporaceae bacterium]